MNRPAGDGDASADRRQPYFEALFDALDVGLRLMDAAQGVEAANPAMGRLARRCRTAWRVLSRGKSGTLGIVRDGRRDCRPGRRARAFRQRAGAAAGGSRPMAMVFLSDEFG